MDAPWPGIPGSRPDGWKCDPLLPIEALAFRRSVPGLLTPEGLGRIKVTVCLPDRS